MLFFYTDFTLKDCSCRPCHIDMVVGFAPLNEKFAAVHDDAAFTSAVASQASCRSYSAGSSATRLCDTRAAFPYANAQAAILQLFYKFNVAAFGKHWAIFQSASLANKVDVGNARHKDDKVRIAHRNECTLIRFSPSFNHSVAK